MSSEWLKEYNETSKKRRKIYKKIDKLCSKKNITCQKDVAWNEDIHLQFRKPLINDDDDQNLICYAECYISSFDIRNRSVNYIIRNIKGFVHMSFKSKGPKGYYRHHVS